MNYTKGPWFNRNGEIGIKDTSDTQSYGMMLTIANIDKYDFDEWEDNANLISAAPDLYEALKAVTKTNKITPELWNQIHCAILKAEGREV
jgi:hypothetical protein